MPAACFRPARAREGGCRGRGREGVRAGGGGGQDAAVWAGRARLQAPREPPPELCAPPRSPPSAHHTSWPRGGGGGRHRWSRARHRGTSLRRRGRCVLSRPEWAQPSNVDACCANVSHWGRPQGTRPAASTLSSLSSPPPNHPASPGDARAGSAATAHRSARQSCAARIAQGWGAGERAGEARRLGSSTAGRRAVCSTQPERRALPPLGG